MSPKSETGTIHKLLLSREHAGRFRLTEYPSIVNLWNFATKCSFTKCSFLVQRSLEWGELSDKDRRSVYFMVRKTISFISLLAALFSCWFPPPAKAARIPASCKTSGFLWFSEAIVHTTSTGFSINVISPPLWEVVARPREEFYTVYTMGVWLTWLWCHGHNIFHSPERHS